MIDAGGKLYVRLFARSVAAALERVAEYEVVDHEPDLVDMHRVGASGSPVARADAGAADEVQA